MKKNHIPSYLISLADYERIFRVIHGFLITEQGDPTRACPFFGIIGAAILNKHHGLNAQVRSGTAIYKIDVTLDNSLLVIGTFNKSVANIASIPFHLWTEVDGWILDFSAPLFPEMVASANAGIARDSRKMFQKRKELAKSSVDEMDRTSDFCLLHDEAETTQRIKFFYENPAYEDILNICVDWYRPVPRKMLKTLTIANAKNEQKQVKLSSLTLDGVW